MGIIRFMKIHGKYYSIMSNSSPENDRPVGNNSNNSSNNGSNNSTNNGSNNGSNNNSNRLGNSVRRCLFGKRTMAEKQKESYLVKNYLGSIARQKSLKYNFDFENHKPLSGNYQWFEVPSAKGADSQTPTLRSIHLNHLLRVPATTDSNLRYRERSEGEIENRLGEDGRGGLRLNDENSNDEFKWSPLSCTTSNYNISNNHTFSLCKRSKNKVITDYFSKDFVERPSTNPRSPLNPSISHPCAPSMNKHASEKRKKVIQDYFPIKKMKTRN